MPAFAVKEFDKLPKWLLLDMLWDFAARTNPCGADDEAASVAVLRIVADSQKDFAKRAYAQADFALEDARAG